MTGFKISNLQKSFAGVSVLKDIQLEVQDATFVSIVGASGGGKSTLLRLVAGLETLDAGEITLAPSLRKSFVFQEPNLLEWRNVFENAHLAFELDPSLQQIFSKTQAHEKVKASLQLVQLGAFAHRFPHELSGGMKMRNSIARALVNEPQLLLMDEPFAALDDNTRFELQIRLREIAQAQKLTVIFVTHNIGEAVFLSDRILQIKEGRLALDRQVFLPSVRQAELRMSTAYLEELQKIYAELL